MWGVHVGTLCLQRSPTLSNWEFVRVCNCAVSSIRALTLALSRPVPKQRHTRPLRAVRAGRSIRLASYGAGTYTIQHTVNIHRSVRRHATGQCPRTTQRPAGLQHAQQALQHMLSLPHIGSTFVTSVASLSALRTRSTPAPFQRPCTALQLCSSFDTQPSTAFIKPSHPPLSRSNSPRWPPPTSIVHWFIDRLTETEVTLRSFLPMSWSRLAVAVTALALLAPHCCSASSAGDSGSSSSSGGSMCTTSPGLSVVSVYAAIDSGSTLSFDPLDASMGLGYRDTFVSVQRGGYDGAAGSSSIYVYGGVAYVMYPLSFGDALVSDDGGLTYSQVNASLALNTTTSLPGLPSPPMLLPAGVHLSDDTLLLMDDTVVYASEDGGATYTILNDTAFPARNNFNAIVVRGLLTASGRKCRGLVRRRARSSDGRRLGCRSVDIGDRGRDRPVVAAANGSLNHSHGRGKLASCSALHAAERHAAVPVCDQG